ncbi:MAG: hypothetical protein Q7U20_05040 [Caulobacter sp.]|nr:hypothetical protein [Caulobacter sp.]
MVTRLTADEIDEAFGLARLAFPGLTPARWRATAKRWAAHPDGANGALLARDGAGRLNGLAPFAVHTNLQAGRSLWVERVASFALLDGRPVVEALARGLHEVARSLGCRGLTVQIETGDRALLAALGRKPGSAKCTLVSATV